MSLEAHQSYDESRRDEPPASQGEDSVEDGKDSLVEGHSEHTCTRTNSQDAGEQHVSTFDVYATTTRERISTEARHVADPAANDDDVSSVLNYPYATDS